ncbi:MAG TPA: YkuS family protein [Firmicutes bacterium]|nr:YkuS family protein [Bacillota bacterium]
MQKIIAVEESLTPIRKYLENKGYQVVGLHSGREADAMVISGGDENMLGMQTVVHNVPVIDARGMRPEDVLRAIEGRWQH